MKELDKTVGEDHQNYIKVKYVIKAEINEKNAQNLTDFFKITLPSFS